MTMLHPVRTAWAGLALSALLLPGPAAAADPAGSATTPAGSAAARFLEVVDSLRVAAHIPGLSVAVVENGRVVLAAGLGVADVGTQLPATAGTAYDAGSVAKPISAVVALRLVELGTIDLDRPMAEYSEWAGFCADFSAGPGVFSRGLRCDPPTHTLRHLLSHTATGEPGTRFSYNPVLYSWASRPIMERADTSFSALVERHVFRPAGMTHSARRHRKLPLRADLVPLLAPPHAVDSLGVASRAPELDAQGDGAAGGVVTTVLDLARFDIALDGGRLLTDASRKAMWTPGRSPAGTTFPYGLGWFIQSYQGETLLWHSGWWPDAYSALYLKAPERHRTLILLANSEGIWWDNPLDEARVERSPFARAFLAAFPAP